MMRRVRSAKWTLPGAPDVSRFPESGLIPFNRAGSV